MGAHHAVPVRSACAAGTTVTPERPPPANRTHSRHARYPEDLMTQSTGPTLGVGKICYVEIPATDVETSAEFYRQAFGWNIRSRVDGATSFDDCVGEVSGSWVLDRPPMTEAGLLIYIMVADIGKAVDGVVAAGGEIVDPVDPASSEVYATFRDPAGNLLGIYQQPGLIDA
jgi:uncharacterized protein